MSGTELGRSMCGNCVEHVAVFGNLYTALDIAHRVEVFVELPLVARTNFPCSREMLPAT